MRGGSESPLTAVGASLAGCALALFGVVATGVETDEGWSEAVWNAGAWPALAWTVTLIGLLASGTALLWALRGDRRRGVWTALAVEAGAALAWLAMAFIAAPG